MQREGAAGGFSGRVQWEGAARGCGERVKFQSGPASLVRALMDA